jgi:hypothetical protein
MWFGWFRPLQSPPTLAITPWMPKQILKSMTVNNMNMRYHVRYVQVWKHNALTPAAPPEYQQTICRSRCKNPWPWTTPREFKNRKNFLLHPLTLRKILGQQKLLPFLEAIGCWSQSHQTQWI